MAVHSNISYKIGVYKLASKNLLDVADHLFMDFVAIPDEQSRPQLSNADLIHMSSPDVRLDHTISISSVREDPSLLPS